MTKLTRRLGRWTGKTIGGVIGLLDDLLVLAGCVAILYGVYLLWSVAVTCIVGGVMAIGLGIVIGMVTDDRSKPS